MTDEARTAPRKPKQKRGESTSARLLDGALRVHVRGHDAFTVHAVVAESGISLGSLYHHFGSFDGLAAALYTRCMERLLDAIVSALSGKRAARSGIEAVVGAYLGFTQSRADEARFIHAAAYATFLPAHAASVNASKAPRIAAIAAWFRPRIAAGEIVPIDEALLEMMLIGAAAETSRRWLSGQPGIDLAEATRVLPRLVARSLLVPPAR